LTVKEEQDKNNETDNKPESDEVPDLDTPSKKSETGRLSRQIEILQSDLDLEQRKTADLSNRMRYLQADIANLQRQSDRRVSEVRNQVKLTWILEILSIKEDLDRAITVARDGHEKSNLLGGLVLVTSRIENILKLESVESIKADVGGRFDPSLHEAVAFQEIESKEQGEILSVISPGYLVEGKVIKPAMVEVSRRKEIKKIPDEGIKSGKKFVEDLELEEPSRQKNT
jgi:molecular chaperone GrpE